MNRLLQGDVGSGKTMVALLTALLAVDNGCQACIMAPTEILAQQHLASFREMLGDLPVRVELLTGSVKTADGSPSSRGSPTARSTCWSAPRGARAQGGLPSSGTRGHRRAAPVRGGPTARLWAKAEISPHILVMTATPIPRTLSMTVYGDLDVSVIDELPRGGSPSAPCTGPTPSALQSSGSCGTRLPKAGRCTWCTPSSRSPPNSTTRI